MVAVYCSANEGIDERYKLLAAEVGTAVAARGWGLVSGGGSVSMMGAVARAVRAGGGHTIGVIPQALIDMEIADHDADELVVTTDMRQRKAIMDDRADAFLALPGGIGTLEELMEVWTARYLSMHVKPVVALDPWNDYAGLRDQVAHWRSAGFLTEKGEAQLHWTDSIDAALDLIASQWTARDGMSP